MLARTNYTLHQTDNWTDERSIAELLPEVSVGSRFALFPEILHHLSVYLIYLLSPLIRLDQNFLNLFGIYSCHYECLLAQFLAVDK